MFNPDSLLGKVRYIKCSNPNTCIPFTVQLPHVYTGLQEFKRYHPQSDTMRSHIQSIDKLNQSIHLDLGYWPRSLSQFHTPIVICCIRELIPSYIHVLFLVSYQVRQDEMMFLVYHTDLQSLKRNLNNFISGCMLF